MGKLIIETYEGGYWGGIRKTKSLKCKSEERAVQIISKMNNVIKWRFYENHHSRRNTFTYQSTTTP